MKIQDDPALADIRAARHKISEEHGHDPQQLVAYYIELQKQFQARLLEPLTSEAPSRTPISQTIAPQNLPTQVSNEISLPDLRS